MEPIVSRINNFWRHLRMPGVYLCEYLEKLRTSDVKRNKLYLKYIIFIVNYYLYCQYYCYYQYIDIIINIIISTTITITITSLSILPSTLL